MKKTVLSIALALAFLAGTDDVNARIFGKGRQQESVKTVDQEIVEVMQNFQHVLNDILEKENPKAVQLTLLGDFCSRAIAIAKDIENYNNIDAIRQAHLDGIRQVYNTLIGGDNSERQYFDSGIYTLAGKMRIFISRQGSVDMSKNISDCAQAAQKLLGKLEESNPGNELHAVAKDYCAKMVKIFNLVTSEQEPDNIDAMLTGAWQK